jgi:hypothetical protein
MIRTALLAICLAIVFLAAPAFAAPVAKVVAVGGSPTAAGPGGSRKLSAGSVIFENDKITVGSGNAQILFVDGTRLVVGPGSTLVIDRFLLRGGTTAQKFSVEALRGTFRFITGKSAKSAYDIKTANATIGIRGTGFDFWVKGDTGVAVHEGLVRLCNSQQNCVDLKAGCEVGVASNTKAEKLKNQRKANVLSTKLPFVTYQLPLNNQFRLNVQACQVALHFGEVGGSGRNQAPTAPPERQQPPAPSPNTP